MMEGHENRRKNPEEEHAIRLVEVLKARNSAKAEEIYRQYRNLRNWYNNQMISKLGPYPKNWLGYVAGYMVRNYRPLEEACCKSGEIAEAMRKAESTAIVGCGGAPELLTVSRRMKNNGRIALLDRHMRTTWADIIDEITIPVVRRCGVPVKQQITKITAEHMETAKFLKNEYDLIIAQQTVNEAAAEYGNNKWATRLARDWMNRCVRQGGSVIVIENTGSATIKTLMTALKDNKPVITEITTVTEWPAEYLKTLSGEWGKFDPPRKAAMKCVLATRT